MVGVDDHGGNSEGPPRKRTLDESGGSDMEKKIEVYLSLGIAATAKLISYLLDKLKKEVLTVLPLHNFYQPPERARKCSLRYNSTIHVPRLPPEPHNHENLDKMLWVRLGGLVVVIVVLGGLAMTIPLYPEEPLPPGATAAAMRVSAPAALPLILLGVVFHLII